MDCRKVNAALHARAFHVAAGLDADRLRAIRAGIERHIVNGTPFREAWPVLAAAS